MVLHAEMARIAWYEREQEIARLDRQRERLGDVGNHRVAREGRSPWLAIILILVVLAAMGGAAVV